MIETKLLEEAGSESASLTGMTYLVSFMKKYYNITDSFIKYIVKTYDEIVYLMNFLGETSEAAYAIIDAYEDYMKEGE